MINNRANNGLVARIRSLYGRRLLAADWAALGHCMTVADAVAYLKYHTAYGELLSDMVEHSVHRGELETLMRRVYLDRTQRLLKQNIESNRMFSCVYLRLEIDRVLYALCVLKGEGDNVVNLPTQEPLRPLLGIDSFDKLVRAYESHPLERAVSAVAHGTEGLSIPHYEARLLRFFYRLVRADMNPRRDAKRLSAMTLQADMEALAVLERLKTRFSLPEGEVLALAEPELSRISHAKWMCLAAAPPGEVRAVLTGTAYRTRLGGEDLHGEGTRLLQSHAVRQIHFSQDAWLVFWGYMTALSIELENLTHVIEGIRYQWGAAAIGDMLYIGKEASSVGH